ncbi:MAG: EAL domain-containing protein [Rhodospirillaceae bacterium]|nr:EAL domain-containing protein [Rhodospirillaceae bacterium]
MDALDRSERHFTELVSATPSGIFETDGQGRLTFVNDRWPDITGQSPVRAIGGIFFDIIHPEDRDAVREEWCRAEGEKPQRTACEFRVTRPDGRSVWVSAWTAPRLDEQGRITGYIGSLADISRLKAAEQALVKSEQRFRTLYLEAPLAYASVSLPDATIIDVNDAWLDLSGDKREDLAGRKLDSVLMYAGRPIVAEAFAEFIESGADATRPFEILRQDGSSIPVAINGRIGRDAQGLPVRMHCIATDISERIRTEDMLRMLNMAVQQSPVSIVITDAHGAIEYVNPSFTEISGYAFEEALGKNPRILKGGGTTDDEYLELWRCITGGTPWHGTFHNKRKDGTLYWEEATIAPVHDSTGALTHFIGIKQDITARREAEARVSFLANHDTLTNLPNRQLGKDRMEWAMAHADRFHGKAGLIFLDLDHFKQVNDSLGHAAGDSLLRIVTERLRACVRETDTVSRQGGDEFLIVLPDIQNLETIARIADTILGRLAESCHIAGHELSTTTSIGIAVYPDDGTDFDTLLNRADTAMYHAKEAGRNAYRFFTPRMNTDANEFLSIRSALQRAIDQEEFVLYYQPQIALDSCAVVGVEALIRWRHPELGLVPPSRFISVAEENGMIVAIGDWVLKEACRQAMAWRKAELPDMVMAVNLSAVQFKRGDLYQSVRAALDTTGFDPKLLELELTESILIKDTENVLTTVQRLKSLGVKLSIDDFGTGYSSLAYLKKLRVDKVKIDQSFVRHITTDSNDSAIVNAIVQMSHGLGLKVIAEGIEDAETLETIRSHRCDEVQGYYFSRPIPAEGIPAYIAEQRQRPTTR